MKTLVRNLLILVLPILFSATSYASLVFSFNEVGGDVTMTASGILDTNNLVSSPLNTWGGTGIEENGVYDLMGGRSFGEINTSYAFHDGTDFSQWASASGPWSASYFGPIDITGSTSFTTYTRSNSGLVPGFGLRAEDLVNGLWTADQNWIISGATFASLGMNVGAYTVSDILNGESISVQIGVSPVPVPAAAWLFGSALLGFFGFSRKKANA